MLKVGTLSEKLPQYGHFQLFRRTTYRAEILQEVASIYALNLQKISALALT